MCIFWSVKISILIQNLVHTTLQGGQSTTESVLTSIIRSHKSSCSQNVRKFREWLIETKWQEFVDNLYKESRKVRS